MPIDASTDRRILVPALGALAVLAALLARPLAAAAQDVPRDPPSAQNFVPAPGRGNYLMLEGARVSGRGAPAFGLVLDYAHEPFVLYDARCASSDPTNCEVTGTRSVLSRYMFTAQLLGAITLFDRLQVGLVVPFAVSAGDAFQVPRDPPVVVFGGGSSVGLGDLRVTAKLRLFGGGEGLGLALTAYGTVPMAAFTAADSFLGNPGPLFGGHFIGEFNASRLHFAANVGGFWRERTAFLSTEVGPRLTYGLGVGYDVTPLLGVLGELTGSSSFSTQVDENALEGRLAGRLSAGDFQFTLGGGAGLLAGVGVPVFRVLGGVAWAPDRTDTDGDGVIDRDDACINEPEDVDGFDDQDGCPDPDNDGDGRLDAEDRCPNEAEDRDGFQDDDGCPDSDNDGDGVPDGYDSCPNEPEDMDGDRDEDGCPEFDRDRDNIRDDVDQCPDAPEDTDGYGDEDGCPEVDFDGDGIPDDGDACPDQPENFNGFEDDDGCPDQVADSDGDGIADPVDRCPNQPETLNGINDEDGCPDGQALVVVQGDRIQLLQQVNFRTGSAIIDGRRSFQILDVVAAILARNPQFRHVRVEGHTDNAGNREANITLSQNRAQACVDYLVQKGIARERLSAQGFGPDRPIDTGRGRRAMARNRRVEFHVETAPQTIVVPADQAPPPGSTPAPQGAAASATP